MAAFNKNMLRFVVLTIGLRTGGSFCAFPYQDLSIAGSDYYNL